MAAEVAEAGLGDLELLAGILLSSDTANFIRVALALSVDISLDIVVGLLDIAGNVEGVTGSFGDGKTVWMLIRVSKVDTTQRNIL